MEQCVDRYLAWGVRFFSAALSDGTPLGLVGLLTATLPNGRTCDMAEIAIIGVYEQHRRLGYGSKLLQYAEQAAIRSGALDMIITTDGDDKEEIAFYQSNGYTVDAVPKPGRAWLYKFIGFTCECLVAPREETCPIKDLRRKTAEERMRVANGMTAEQIAALVDEHKTCFAKRIQQAQEEMV
ncbi:MAG TPA: GNAT family N-acetyltransferase [Phycisphaerae bacterium]|nr:GNAT family N-acetyltransferase [Phycisphaerae bacterium]